MSRTALDAGALLRQTWSVALACGSSILRSVQIPWRTPRAILARHRRTNRWEQPDVRAEGQTAELPPPAKRVSAILPIVTWPTPTGEREINPEEAAVIRRIFEQHVAGVSSKQMAKTLNREGVRAVRRERCGARARSTATLSAASGCWTTSSTSRALVWNRQRFVKDPDTGKRLARLNPPSECVLSASSFRNMAFIVRGGSFEASTRASGRRGDDDQGPEAMIASRT
jgi:hypothetical protein